MSALSDKKAAVTDAAFPKDSSDLSSSCMQSPKPERIMCFLIVEL